MELTKKYIENAFNKYNELYFNGFLQKPYFNIKTTRNQLGCLSTKIRGFNKEYTLSVSNYYDRTEKQYDETIIHEMIHLYVRQKGIIDNGPHGRYFKYECARINKYGWNLSRCTDTSGWKVSEDVRKKEEIKAKRTIHHIIVFKECDKGSQFFVKVSKPNVNVFFHHLRLECKYECQYFSSYDSIFNSLPNCRKRIVGRRIYENDVNNAFAKYMIK